VKVERELVSVGLFSAVMGTGENKRELLNIVLLVTVSWMLREETDEMMMTKGFFFDVHRCVHFNFKLDQAALIPN
jgi:hypothetical protein